MCQSIVAKTKTVVVHGSELLTRLLLLLNPRFKLSNIEEKSVDLGRPLDEDAGLELRAERAILASHSLLELLVGHTAPRLEQSLHFLAVQGVSGVGGLAGLALVHGEVHAPGLPHGALTE